MGNDRDDGGGGGGGLRKRNNIQAFDIDAYFEKLGLIAHLSPSRGNGLKAIVEQIKTQAL